MKKHEVLLHRNTVQTEQPSTALGFFSGCGSLHEPSEGSDVNELRSAKVFWEFVVGILETVYTPETQKEFSIKPSVDVRLTS